MDNNSKYSRSNLKTDVLVLMTEFRNLNDRFDRHVVELNKRMDKWEEIWIPQSTKVEILMDEREGLASPKRLGWTAILLSTFFQFWEMIRKQ